MVLSLTRLAFDPKIYFNVFPSADSWKPETHTQNGTENSDGLTIVQIGSVLLLTISEASAWTNRELLDLYFTVDKSATVLKPRIETTNIVFISLLCGHILDILKGHDLLNVELP